jgi:hypothetical protein
LNEGENMRKNAPHLYAMASLMLVLIASFSILGVAGSLNGQTPSFGRVYAVDGEPLTNAMVVAIGDVGYGYALTGGDGSYAINEGLTTDIYEVYVTAFGYIDAQVPSVSITAAATTTLDFFLNCSGGISGTIRNNIGTPLPGISVIAVSDDGNYFGYASPTDASGQYLLATNLEAGTYNVTVLFPQGYVSNTVSGVSVTRSVETKNVDLTLSPSSTITGTVTGSNGVPIANASVTAVSSDTLPYVGFAVTDAAGSYVIDSGLGTGTYLVMASKNGAFGSYGGFPPTDLAVVAGETVSNIDITITLSPSPTGSISGTVVDTEGWPIAEATVSASGAGSGSASSDANGDYTIYGLDPGTYAVDAWANGFQSQDIPDVPVVAYEDTPETNFQLAPLPPEQSGILTGTVTGQANPIPEFTLWTTLLLLVSSATAITLLKAFQSRKPGIRP